MAVTINADTSNGLVLTPDTSGEIKLQAGGADIATVTSSGITMASGKTLPAASLTGTVPSSSVDALSTASGSAPSYSARAWVNFNGTGTVAIRESGNVSSITDNGTGNYTVNFTTAMSDNNYTVNVTGKDNGGYLAFAATGTYSTIFTTSSIQIETFGSGQADSDYVGVSIFR